MSDPKGINSLRVLRRKEGPIPLCCLHGSNISYLLPSQPYTFPIVEFLSQTGLSMPLTALLRLPRSAQPLTRQPRFKTIVSTYHIPPRSLNTNLLGMTPDLNLFPTSSSTTRYSAAFTVPLQSLIFTSSRNNLRSYGWIFEFCYPQRMVGGEWRIEERGLE
jgi:hypothetical protein